MRQQPRNISPLHLKESPGQHHAQQIGWAHLRRCASGNTVWFPEDQIHDRHGFCLEAAAGEEPRESQRPLHSLHQPQHSF